MNIEKKNFFCYLSDILCFSLFFKRKKKKERATLFDSGWNTNERVKKNRLV